MRIVVTGAAGFIGSNFVHHWLGQSPEPLVNLDALTYAGNLSNLARWAGDARHVFVKGDIGNRALVEQKRLQRLHPHWRLGAHFGHGAQGQPGVRGARGLSYHARAGNTVPTHSPNPIRAAPAR